MQMDGRTDRQTSAGAELPAPSSTSAPPPGTRTPEALDPPSPGWPDGEPPSRSLPRSLATVLHVQIGEIRVDILAMTSRVCEFGGLQLMTSLRTFVKYVTKWILIIHCNLFNVRLWEMYSSRQRGRKSFDSSDTYYLKEKNGNRRPTQRGTLNTTRSA